MSDMQAVKYRVIGALVIVASFTAAWWLLLDHDVRRLQEDKMEIPKPMPVERFSIEEPKQPAAFPAAEQAQALANTETAPAVEVPVADAAKADAPAVEEVASADAPAEKKQPDVLETAKPVASVDKTQPVTSSLDEKALPEAWVLQLASVKNKDNAEALKQKLLATHFPAYVKTFNTPDGTNYRVLVGPKLSQVRAAEMAAEIELRHGIKNILVMRFKPGYEE